MITNKIFRNLLFVFVVFFFIFSFQIIRTSQGVAGGQIKVTSTAFEEGGMIPEKYTCDGLNISPPLGWTNFPKRTKAFAIICDDPDAPMGTWVHWVVFNLPANITKLPEHVPVDTNLKNGGMQGKSSFGEIGYGGPCPPNGTHRYYFKVYALSKKLENEPDMTKTDLLKAMEGSILSEGQLMGKYKR